MGLQTAEPFPSKTRQRYHNKENSVKARTRYLHRKSRHCAAVRVPIVWCHGTLLLCQVEARAWNKMLVIFEDDDSASIDFAISSRASCF